MSGGKILLYYSYYTIELANMSVQTKKKMLFVKLIHYRIFTEKNIDKF